MAAADDKAKKLAALGLPADASPEDVRAARARLDEVLADLEAAPGADRTGDEEAREQAEQTPSAARRAAEPSTVADGDTYVDVAELDAADEPTADEPAPARAAAAAPKAAKPRTPRRNRRPRTAATTRQPASKKSAARRRIALGLMALLVPGLVWGVYSTGAPAKQMPANHPEVSQSAAPQASFDAAKAAELNKKIEANPEDIDARRALATMHFRAGQYKEAIPVLEALLQRRPQDFDAKLITGVAYFNTGDMANAEKHWTSAAQQDPNSPDPHYNLGFLHMSSNPPDMAKVEAEWRKVVELAPDSELAKTVTSHMEKLNDGATPNKAPTTEAKK